MCFFNTPGAIKVLAAFCFCVNMFNLIYLFIRYYDLMPPDALRMRKDIESVIPDVKNLDKYLAPRDSTVFLSSLAAISVVFDYILYIGVEQQHPGLILSAWLWGIIDCSFDAAIGIASGNMTIMDSLARQPDFVPTTKPVESSLDIYRKTYGTAPLPKTVKPLTTQEPPLSNDTEYVHARKKQVVGNQEAIAGTELYRPHVHCGAQVGALAGIKDYASYVVAQRQTQQLDKRLDYEAEEASIKAAADAGVQQVAVESCVPVQPMLPPLELVPQMPPPPTVPPYPLVDSMPVPHLP
ncbi:uncharacterized protein LOC144129888 [Amblyomma americanum]